MGKKFPAVALTAVLLLVISAACQRSDTPSSFTVIEGATVIDGVSSEPIPDAVILIEGTMVRSVGPREEVSIPGNAQRINAAGKTIIPGIFCMHEHIAMAEGMERKAEFYNRERIQRDANAYLYYGVMHAVSLGIDLEPMQGFLADQRAGRAGGARMYSAGLGFATPDGWQPAGYNDINRPRTANEAREMVQREVETKKPDLIKIWVDDQNGTLPKIPPALYGAIIEEAHVHNLPVFAHLRYLDDAKELIRRGVDVLAHQVRDKEVDEEFLELAKARGIAVLPLLAGAQADIAYAEGASFLSDPGLPVLFPASVLQTLGSKEYQEGIARSRTFANSQKDYEIASRNTAKIAAAGIPIAVGSDSGSPGRFPGLWEHREMELLVKAGLTPMQAIQAATINGARILKLDGQYGSLAPHRAADFIILNGDPLTDITNSRKIDSVWMNGKQVDRNALAPPRTGG